MHTQDVEAYAQSLSFGELQALVEELTAHKFTAKLVTHESLDKIIAEAKSPLEVRLLSKRFLGH